MSGQRLSVRQVHDSFEAKWLANCADSQKKRLLICLYRRNSPRMASNLKQLFVFRHVGDSSNILVFFPSRILSIFFPLSNHFSPSPYPLPFNPSPFCLKFFSLFHVLFLDKFSYPTSGAQFTECRY